MEPFEEEGERMTCNYYTQIRSMKWNRNFIMFRKNGKKKMCVFLLFQLSTLKVLALFVTDYNLGTMQNGKSWPANSLK